MQTQKIVTVNKHISANFVHSMDAKMLNEAGLHERFDMPTKDKDRRRQRRQRKGWKT